jgi:hypothetical protein
MARPVVMSIDETLAELQYWIYRSEAERELAFSELLGNVAFRAVDDPYAADVLRRIRERAELS